MPVHAPARCRPGDGGGAALHRFFVHFATDAERKPNAVPLLNSIWVDVPRAVSTARWHGWFGAQTIAFPGLLEPGTSTCKRATDIGRPIVCEKSMFVMYVAKLVCPVSLHPSSPSPGTCSTLTQEKTSKVSRAAAPRQLVPAAAGEGRSMWTVARQWTVRLALDNVVADRFAHSGPLSSAEGRGPPDCRPRVRRERTQSHASRVGRVCVCVWLLLGALKV